MDFIVPVDNRVEIKEREKIEKYLYLARKLKKQWKMSVTVIPAVDGALRIVSKGLVKKDCKTEKSAKELRLSKLHYCWDRPEYWEES